MKKPQPLQGCGFFLCTYDYFSLWQVLIAKGRIIILKEGRLGGD